MQDGVQLMDFLSTNTIQLPDILFLDLNLSCKNGVECLFEIKADDAMKDLPVVIFLTSFIADKYYEESMMDLMLSLGALRFMSKSDDYEQFRQDIHQVLILVEKNKAMAECNHRY